MIQFRTLFYREIKRFWRVVGQTILTPMITATLYLMIFGVSVGSQLEMGGQTSYLMFIVPGMIMMGVLNNAFQNSAGSVLIAKFHGELEDMRTAPLNDHTIVWAKSLASLLRGIIVGAMILMTAEVFTWVQGSHFFGIAHPFWMFFFLVVGGLSFGHLGLTIGFFATNFDQVNAFGQFIVLPLIYLGGVFFTLEALHPFWQAVSLVNPLLYFINGVRYAVLGTSDLPLMACALISAFGLALFTVLAYASVRHGSYTRF